MCGIGIGEAVDPAPQRRPAAIVARHDRELIGDGLHVAQRVPQKRPEQVVLVGEIQIESPVRRLGPADNVVHPDRLEAALVEFGQTSLEQPTYRLPALGSEFTALSRDAAAK